MRRSYLHAPTAPIHERDIAAVAVCALLEDGHSGAEYILTGPESLSQHEQISTIGNVLAQQLRVTKMPAREARRDWPDRTPAYIVDMLLNAWNAAIGQPALVTSTVADVTKAQARTFHDWAVENAGEFRISAARPASRY